MNVGALYFNVMEKLKFDPRIDESNITIAVTNDSIVVSKALPRNMWQKSL